MNTNVRLFDANNKLVTNFDEEIEKILISIHGEDYFDVDEELINTNMIPIEPEIYHDEELEKTMELVDAMVDKNAKEIKLVKNEKQRVSIKDFIPVLFFMLIFGIIVVAGYYFLNTVDLMNLVGSLKWCLFYGIIS